MKAQHPDKTASPCFECENGTLHPIAKDYTAQFRGHDEITIKNVAMLRCDQCGDTVIGDEGNETIENELRRITKALSPVEWQAFLDRYELTQHQASAITGLGEKNISRWLRGKARASESISNYIRLLLASPAAFETLKEIKFTAGKPETSFEEKQPDTNEKIILKEVDYTKLSKIGLVTNSRSPLTQRTQLCQLIGHDNLVDFGEAMKAHCLRQAAFKDSQQQFSPISGGLWIKLGEMAAHRMTVAPYDRNKLADVADELRQFTQKEPQEVFNDVRERLASAGVALVVVPIFKRSAYRGCTRLLSPTKAMILHGLKFKNIAEFWKVLFHEIAHLILHVDTPDDVFAEYENRSDDPSEQEADEWADKSLINGEDLLSFIVRHRNRRPTLYDLHLFATDQKVHPAIAAEAVNRKTGFEAFPYAHLRKQGLFPVLSEAQADTMWQISRVKILPTAK
jgi:HTH-type transcriptional regulator/antitoxin HigA